MSEERKYLDYGVYAERDAACDGLVFVSLGLSGDVQMDHRISIVPGRPSVLFRRQLCHILRIVSHCV
jgi:hypothetical protein